MQVRVLLSPIFPIDTLPAGAHCSSVMASLLSDLIWVSGTLAAGNGLEKPRLDERSYKVLAKHWAELGFNSELDLLTALRDEPELTLLLALRSISTDAALQATILNVTRRGGLGADEIRLLERHSASFSTLAGVRFLGLMGDKPQSAILAALIKTVLLNTPVTPPVDPPVDPPVNTLLDGLVAHWALEEESGTRATSNDTVFGLTASGTAARAAGKVGFGVEPGSGALSRVSSAALQLGSGDFTIAVWARADFGGTGGIVCKWEEGAKEYALRYDLTNFYFSVSLDGSDEIAASDPTAAEPGQWYFIRAWFSAADERIYISINGAAPTSTLISSATLAAGAADFSVGRDANAGESFPGAIDEVTIWNRLLTNDEAATLYNNGDGVAYPWA